jgi:pimeloyl-ACP methyl ester carboxylesterase
METQHPLAATVQNYRPLAELLPAHWQTGSVDAEDGTRLHYTRTGGEKPALLLLHGFQVNGLIWLRTAKALEASYDVVMPDVRGHGKSGSAEKGMAWNILVNDAISVIDALGLEKPYVVGHSMGAESAGRLAAAYPVRAVVLVDPALLNFAAAMASVPKDADGMPPWMQSIIETMQALKTQDHRERMVTGLRMLMPGAPLMGEEDYVSFMDAQAEFDLATFRHTTNMSPLFESPDVIANIACPVLLLTARIMMPVPGASNEAGLAAFKSNWREGEHIHFDDSGHFIMGEQFERFIEVVSRFLDEH